MNIDFSPLRYNLPALIASDYDGTLAPFVSDPTKAFPNSQVWQKFITLANIPQVHIALLSGRGRKELLKLSNLGDIGLAVGSHGSELPDVKNLLTPEQQKSKDIILDQFTQFADSLPGARAENKPTGVALHVRPCENQAGEALLSQAYTWVQSLNDVRIIPGNKVLEVALVHANKGTGLAYLINYCSAKSALYIGDDTTDEDGFIWLKEHMLHSISIKVGPGSTNAQYQIENILSTGKVFEELYQYFTNS